MWNGATWGVVCPSGWNNLSSSSRLLWIEASTCTIWISLARRSSLSLSNSSTKLSFLSLSEEFLFSSWAFCYKKKSWKENKCSTSSPSNINKINRYYNYFFFTILFTWICWFIVISKLFSSPWRRLILWIWISIRATSVRLSPRDDAMP